MNSSHVTGGQISSRSPTPPEPRSSRHAHKEIAHTPAPDAWQRLSAGEGTKGARLHDWAYCELADLDADEYDETKSGLWTRGLLIRHTVGRHLRRPVGVNYDGR